MTACLLTGAIAWFKVFRVSQKIIPVQQTVVNQRVQKIISSINYNSLPDF